MSYACDVRDGAAVDALSVRILKELKRVDVLVNSAGTNVTRRAFADMSPASYDEVLGANLHGAVRRQAVRHDSTWLQALREERHRPRHVAAV